ncbi:MAG: 50S ribosomal protein L29 [Candidatus Marinimicrobia bacterium]|jgi:large subunit ribosomal protein L29|nr:50S ribosomal protein L29 [Candidatus Neomarinimicrobiota bacterium]MBT3945792.1 50S ribosomal protein L29 [Candidatus Neomarinimicrobiota bacterium]MBT4155468.1 50S ribosomal protein L29 [Candidatus Neomarinimicrobiota bacterium]MBT4555258.1 50S ribosomal protein L29 [Candidatus Neomarinimicrobiota bacterium]MBT4752661.1 50S ribosomal protein L29 [Candidatus Neomarinimicrobiota bacterium]|tara:strand:- start:26871 stop:27089 length:219 start_codon:yes stop_codon:yes gene_type:complete
MKVEQLREMNELELHSKLNEDLEALQNLKFQQALQQLEDGTLIPKIKKEIAQIKTVLNEYKLGLRVAQGEKV